MPIPKPTRLDFYLGAKGQRKRDIYAKMSAYERYLAKMAEYDLKNKGMFRPKDYNEKTFEASRRVSPLEKKPAPPKPERGLPDNILNSFGHSGGLGSRGMFQMSGNY